MSELDDTLKKRFYDYGTWSPNFVPLKELDAEMDAIAALYPNPIFPTLSKPPCQHVFVEYVGLTDSFHYCKHCDKKKER